ncbi:MAG: DNA cytosine methyltransferase [Desulfovibrionaceae bacterium]|nr:DNA cytosine methyltransferase [Desulfovibrionaceae bacterium]
MTRLISLDIFAGAGGASWGHYLATGRHPDIAINHNPLAVEIHALNHPETEHWAQNIYNVSPQAVVRGRRVGHMWASPDCTYHSVARGGKPVRVVAQRDLPFVISGKWLPALRPLVFQMENVKEILGWGPLDAGGRIVKSGKGDYWRSFVRQIRRQGYAVEWRVLRACDYGVATTRERLYLTARRDGRPIVWPEPTHGAPDSPEVLAGLRKPWRTAAEFIDWSLPCPSIFDSSGEIKARYGLQARRPLRDSSQRRIARGLKRFVLDNPRPFVVHYFGDNDGRDFFRGAGLDEPLSTVTAGGNRHGLVMPYIYNASHSRSTSHVRAADAPMGTILTKSEHALAVAHLIKYYGTDQAPRLDMPLDTCTTKPHFGLALSWLSKMRGENIGQDPDTPLHTLSAGGNHFAAVSAFLTKFYGRSTGQALETPLHTVRPGETFGLVICHVNGEPYALADIGMRMLQPYEQAGCMGFPPGYHLARTAAGPVTKEDQNMLIGNAVCPGLAAVLIHDNYPAADSEFAWQPPRSWQPTFWPSRETAMGVAL